MSAQEDPNPRREAAAVPVELAEARALVAAACRDATRRVRRRAVERAAAAHDRAALEVAALRGAVDDAAQAARDRRVAPSGAAATTSVGRAHVRRHTRATAGVDVPVLAPIGPGGGVCAVAADDGLPDVLALLESLVLGAAVGVTGAAPPLVVVNPRARPLPPAVAALPGLRLSRDARPALAAALPPQPSGSDPAAGPAAQLVVLDFPHGLGLAGRRLAHEAAAGVPGAPWPVLIHVAPDAPEVDALHRRFRIPRCGVPMPEAPCELWWGRGRWTWTQRPGLVVRLERDGGTAVARPAPATARGPRAARGTPADDDALRSYHDALDGLVRVARHLDAELATIRARERAALDGIARRRRQRLDDLLRRAGHGARAPADAGRDRGPPRRPGEGPPGVRHPCLDDPGGRGLNHS